MKSHLFLFFTCNCFSEVHLALCFDSGIASILHLCLMSNLKSRTRLTSITRCRIPWIFVPLTLKYEIMVITWGIQLVLSYNRFLIKLIKFYHLLFYLSFINWCCQRNMPYCKLCFKGSIMVLYKRYAMLYSEGLCFSSKCFSVCNLSAVTYSNQNYLLNRKELIVNI